MTIHEFESRQKIRQKHYEEFKSCFNSGKAKAEFEAIESAAEKLDQKAKEAAANYRSSHPDQFLGATLYAIDKIMGVK